MCYLSLFGCEEEVSGLDLAVSYICIGLQLRGVDKYMYVASH